MIKITELEEFELRELYEKARTEDTTESLNSVRVFYRKLGKKYKFNPLRVTINTKGEVWPITKENVFVVTDKNNSGIIMVTRSKIKALELELEHESSYNMTEVPLECLL